jgi:hypothetical protein
MDAVGPGPNLVQQINSAPTHHTSMSVFKIIPTTQQYDWGKTGKNSKVAQLAAAAELPGFELDEKATYAEVCRIFSLMLVGRRWSMSS